MLRERLLDADPSEARRYARAFDRRDSDDLGKPSLLSLLPIGLARRAARRSEGRNR